MSDQPNMLAVALRYAGGGINVFPVNGSKEPITPNGFHDATTDRMQIERWWTGHPNAGIATPDFDAVDVDLHKPTCAETWDRIRPLIPTGTPQTKTGGGGLQFLFRAGTLADGKIGPGVDSRYAGRNYIILPPSPHKSGNRYETVIDVLLHRPKPAPAFPLDAAKQRNGSAPPVEETIPEGERNSTLASLAGTMRRRGMTKTEILAALREVNGRRCKPPLAEDDLERIASSIARYPSAAPAGSTAATPSRKPARRVLTTTAAEVERAQVDWLEPGRVPLGQVTVVAGIGGVGKSQWTCLLTARVSCGELGEAATVLVATAEDDPSTTVRPRLEAVQANLGLVRFLAIATGEGDEDGIAIPDDVPQLEEAVRFFGARLVIIDPLVAHLPGEIDSHRDQSVRRALAPLYRLAKNTGCAVVVVLHLNKATGLAPLMRLGASVAFGNAARSVLLLDRDPDDPDGERGHRRVLAHIKCNLAPLAPSLLYQVAPIVLPAEGTEPMVETSRLELLGESELDGRALLNGGDEDERSEIAEAVDFLRDFLADGTRQRAADVYKAAKELHIHDKTVQRAARRLGVQREKAGFTRGWEWWLHEEDNPESAENANPHSSTKTTQGDTHTPLSPSAVTEEDNYLACLDEEDNVEPPREACPLREESDDDIPF